MTSESITLEGHSSHAISASIAGTDEGFPVTPEAHFRNLVPHAEYSDIADATHMVVGDQNDAFGEAIVDFQIRTHGQEITP